MNKYILILLTVIFIGGITISYFKGYNNGILEKIANQKPCPACPPQTKIDLGNSQFDKLNNKKGIYNIYQTFDHVSIDVCDSIMYKNLTK